MGVDTIFRIYSMTKPLMSVGLMTLVEDGVVQLTDPSRDDNDRTRKLLTLPQW